MSQYVSTDEVITFASQEEFEDAVMKVVMERLKISGEVLRDDPGWQPWWDEALLQWGG